MAQADILVRAFDQAGNVRHGAAAEVAELDHAHHRLQRGEGVVGDLRLRGGEPGKQGGLPCIGQALEPRVGDGAQFKVEVGLLAVLAGGELARSLMRGGGVVLVALASFAAFAQGELLAHLHQIGHLFERLFHLARLFIEPLDDAADHQTRRHFEVHTLARTTALVGVATQFAIFCMQTAIEEKSAQAVGAVVHTQDDVSAPAAIAAVRTAFGTKFATMEMHSAIAATPCASMNLDMINKHII